MKKQFRSQASSGRAAGAAAFGTFGSSSFETRSSPLSYVYEPPDLSGIADGNIVVSFKNLMKKDGTTKSKALEDILSHISGTEVKVEDALLSAWVKLYPRLSIDTSRRVRQLSHTLLGHIVAKCGKRMAPYLPQVTGPWLCGTFDSDRGVSRAAQDALKQAFASPEKIDNIWKVMQRPVAEYVKDAVLKETPRTLSDERNVSKEDSEATYHRVVATCLAVATNLLSDLSSEDLSKLSDIYLELLNDQTVIELSAASDPAARRALFRLLRSSLTVKLLTDQIDFPKAGSILISKAMAADQASTASELTTLLVDLTIHRATIWSSDYKSKRSADQRLRGFLKRGSQVSTDYWPNTVKLISSLPDTILPRDTPSAEEFISAVHEGVVHKDERLNASTSWPSYFRIVDLVLRNLPESEEKSLLHKWILPVIQQYLEPSEATINWTIPGTRTEIIAAASITCQGVGLSLVTIWPQYTDHLIDSMKLSHPEQSKDFATSQNTVIMFSQRWITLQSALASADPAKSPVLQKVFVDQTARMCEEAMKLLKSRQGKPYGAAAVVGDIVRQLKDNEDLSTSSASLISAFLEKDATAFLFSPSQSYLFAALYEMPSDEAFQRTWTKWTDAILNHEDTNAVLSALDRFLTASKDSRARDLAKRNAGIQTFLQQHIVNSDTEVSNDVAAKLMPFLADETQANALTECIAKLSIGESGDGLLKSLEVLERADPRILKEVISGDAGHSLLPQLILVEQSDRSETSGRARALRVRLGGEPGAINGQSLSLDLLERELGHASPSSLPMPIIIDMVRMEEASSAENLLSIVLKLLPGWQTSSLNLASARPAPSLALNNPLGGTVHLIPQDAISASDKIIQDSDGLSSVFRTAMFALLVFESDQVFENIDTAAQTELLFVLSVTALLVDDNLSVSGTNSSWSRRPSSISTDLAVELTASVRKQVNQRLVNSPKLADAYLDKALGSIGSFSPSDFMMARAYAYAAVEVLDSEGHSKHRIQKLEDQIKQHRQNKDLVLSALVGTLATELSASSYMQKLCNELVSDITGAEVSQDSDSVLQKLTVLNLIIDNADKLDTIIAKQRVVFYVRHTMDWLEALDVGPPIKAEILRSYRVLLPLMGDIYGEHWSTIIEIISKIWLNGFQGERQHLDEQRLVLVHHSLRLQKVLSTQSKYEDPNEDLLDALKEHESALIEGILHLLTQDLAITDTEHTPLRMTNDLVGRQAQTIKALPADNANELYPQLDSTSSAIQAAAFSLLGKHISSTQEQISLDAALEKKAAHLPEELLSLLLAAPDTDTVLSASFDDQIPQDLQTYLYSWLLVFKHFEKASHKVKEDYVDDLRSGDHLGHLLDLIYEFLGHTTGQAVDASKFDITGYTLHQEESPERDTQQILTHLYYLCLLRLASLTKPHFLSVTNRQTSSSISTWTAKYISPQIIGTSLASVQDWSASFASDPEYESFTVKVSQRAKEITASYLVDEQTMAILVRLPDEYPLQGAKVEGISRVAVDTKKWQSWLRSCQGVIQFSNGDLVDGLSAWRSNVRGALKNQTECAICYSVISADRQLPSKRCLTCKNLFHSGCLFKWFKSSNASTCPLCRNPFNYG